MSSKSLLMSPMMDLQLPPTPPMDLSDSNSNSSNDYKVSFIEAQKLEQQKNEKNPKKKCREWKSSRASRVGLVTNRICCPAKCFSRQSRKDEPQPRRMRIKNHSKPLGITRTRRHTNISPSRSHPLPFIVEHAAISCFSREHFLFRLWTLAWRTTIFIYQRRAKQSEGEEEEAKSDDYTPIECRFLVCCSIEPQSLSLVVFLNDRKSATRPSPRLVSGDKVALGWELHQQMQCDENPHCGCPRSVLPKTSTQFLIQTFHHDTRVPSNEAHQLSSSFLGLHVHIISQPTGELLRRATRRSWRSAKREKRKTSAVNSYTAKLWAVEDI